MPSPVTTTLLACGAVSQLADGAPGCATTAAVAALAIGAYEQGLMHVLRSAEPYS